MSTWPERQQKVSIMWFAITPRPLDVAGSPFHILELGARSSRYAALDPSVASKARKDDFVKSFDHFNLLPLARN